MRKLTKSEIETLKNRGCTAENWANIAVADYFSTEFISNVHFAGKNTLGMFNKIFEFENRIRLHSGIYNCYLNNCTIGNNVYLNKINNYISNYIVENEAFIENVNCIETVGKSAFGNGTRIAVVNENGGREIPIFEKLSAQLAYLLTFFRSKKKFISQIEKQIDSFAEKNASNFGVICSNSTICNCGTIRNVKIGEFAKIEGAARLENGTVLSSKIAPTFVGENVTAKDFIFAQGSKISGSASVEKCFVGEATIIDKNFSATDSAFFANCQCFNGEAVSVFAAPFTVTHHKSTLLIANYCAFLNAGSGANQSNHAYKLGAVHQGIIERGAKLGSFSYIIFPAHVGAFTAVIGQHKNHPDISEFPFSYLIENEGQSWLVPAAVLKSVGTIRDAEKWRERDLRKSENSLDIIDFEIFSPYSIGKILEGIKILNSLLKNTTEIVDYKGVKIKHTAIKKGLEIYQLAVNYFIGLQITENQEFISKNNFPKNISAKQENWLDIAGIYAPENEINNLISEVENGKCDLENFNKKIAEIHENYKKYSFEWTMHLLPENELVSIIKTAKQAGEKLKEFWREDAKKEFDETSQIGYFTSDFEAVRGKYAENPFVKKLINHWQ